jgi:LacI family transcriptional regulator
MTRTADPKKVALAFPTAVSWLAVLADGVADYARRHGGWDFTTSPPTLAEAEELALTTHSLKDWPGDGVIAIISDRAEARAARRLEIPVVSVGGNLRDCGLPRVMVDPYAVGRLAAEHLLQRGLRQLAYYGLRGPWYSQERRRGFVDRAVAAGVPCEVFEMPPNTDPRATWLKRRAPLAQWLQRLPLPVGILAVHDYRARVLVDECVRLGLDVPHDVAVLGVDNDRTVCEFCQPTLSSVSRSAWQVGYEAAALLDRLMSGQPAPRSTILIPPDGVVARRSTDTVAVDDPHVGAAVHFMRDHLSEVFGIEQVMKHVSVSRRRLHELFLRLLQRTPYEYLCHLRVERAKQLLAVPQRVKMQKIAAACGFSSPARMRLVFQRVAGTTPLAYHRRHGGILAANSADPGQRRTPTDRAG